jgi:ATP-binding cassette subfamily C (CFTR/MRP) protein 1
LLETIDGLTTIRAFGWQIEFTNLNAQRLDDSQKPYYLLFCIQQWLRLVLDMIVAGMAVLVVALALSFKNSTNAGLLGVSMNSVLCESSDRLAHYRD